MWVKINGSTKTVIEKYPDSVVHPTLQCWFIAFHSLATMDATVFSSFESFHPGSQLQGCKTWVRTKGLMYCPNPTAVWDISNPVSKKNTSGSQHPSSYKPTFNICIYRYNSFPLKKQPFERKMALSIIDIQRFSFSAKVFPSLRSPTIDIRTAILWTCNGSDHRPSKVASFQGWVQQWERGGAQYVCHTEIQMYKTISSISDSKRVRLPVTTIESSGCSWLPTIPMASPQKGPRVVMSARMTLETAMFFLCLSWFVPKACHVKDF